MNTSQVITKSFNPGWLTLIAVIIINTAVGVWGVSNIYTAVSVNTNKVDVNRIDIDTLAEEQRKQSEKVYSIKYIQRDIETIQSDVKEIKQAIQVLSNKVST